MKIPKFKTAKEEAEFWETHSPLDFADQFEEVKEPIVDRRARKKGIYIRVDPEAIELARSIGADLGLGYQTLFRMWIMEGLARVFDVPVSRLERMLSSLPPESQKRVVEVFRCAVDAEKIGDLEGRYGARRSS